MSKFALITLALGGLVLPITSAFADGPAPVWKPVVLPQMTTTTMPYQPGITSSCDTCHKVCVAEPKPTTKVVYGCVAKDICAPGVSLFGGCCDKDCEGGTCAKVRVRNVLVKKIVPGPLALTCVARDVTPYCPPAKYQWPLVVEPLQVAPTPVKK